MVSCGGLPYVLLLAGGDSAQAFIDGDVTLKELKAFTWFLENSEKL